MCDIFSATRDPLSMFVSVENVFQRQRAQALRDPCCVTEKRDLPGRSQIQALEKAECSLVGEMRLASRDEALVAVANKIRQIATSFR